MRNKGSITLFFSILFGACITLIMALTESARLFGVNTRFESAAEAAMHSLFSMYDGDLLEDFDLMLLNTADLEEYGGIEGVLTLYLEKSFSTRSDYKTLYGNLFRGHVISCTATETIDVLDDQGEFFAREVLDYMKYRTLKIAGTKVKELLTQQEAGASAKKQLEIDMQAEDEALGQETDAQQQENSAEAQDELTEGWLGKLAAIQRNGWIEFVLPFEQTASEYRITPGALPSDHDMETLQHPVTAPGDIEEALFFTEYLLEHCSCYTVQQMKRDMCYELEYIISGKETDKENLKNTLEKLLLLREGMNIMTIMKEEDLLRQAESAARALTGWTGQETLVRFTQLAIVSGWAYTESLVDLRTLLHGGNVPMLKNREQWVLAYQDIGTFLNGKKNQIFGGDEGMSYLEYLRLLLYQQDKVLRRFRTMDVIQLRLRTYKPEFYMQNCLYAVRADLKISQKPLFFSFGGRQYIYLNAQSRMY